MAEQARQRANNERTLSAVVDGIVESYHAHPSTHHFDAVFLPSRARSVEILERLRRLIFPGFFDEKRLSSRHIREHTGGLVEDMHGFLYEQIRQALRYQRNRDAVEEAAQDADALADEKALSFLERVPELRRLLSMDVHAAFEGDPAAVSPDETIFCYPGLDAVFIHRAAHELYKLDVPLIPRIMSEYAHNETGIDIHPGAQIGESFFIDHGTGVVVGETCVIGNRVKMYQGVSLGALSTRGGQAWRGRKRHPTIEDDVTIYGGAIILGGDTVIGQGATVGGSVFLTRSVPAGHTVTMKQPELQMSEKKPKGRGGVDASVDFQI